MNILIDENALWLARPSNIKYLTDLRYTVRAIGQDDCPPIRSADFAIAHWCRSQNFAILTYDFDDFYRMSKEVVILGLIQRGVFQNRPDIIAKCVQACLNTSGESKLLSPGLYVLSNYNW